MMADQTDAPPNKRAKIGANDNGKSTLLLIEFDGQFEKTL